MHYDSTSSAAKKISAKQSSRHDEIRKKIENSYRYFKKNYDRFNEFYYFTFVSTLTSQDIGKLQLVNKPPLSFNINEAFISRLRGAFMSNQPGVAVRASDGVMTDDLTDDFTFLQQLIEAHLREILFNVNNDEMGYQVYTDLLVGGFSVIEVYTDYVSQKSFLQNIKACRAEFPALCFFDETAKDSHKGDGKFCGKLFMITKQEFERKYGKQKAMSMPSGFAGFSWQYNNGRDDVVTLAEYYEKVEREETIVQLANGKVMTKNEYAKFIEAWDAAFLERGLIEQAPAVIQERKTILCRIDRYVLSQDSVLEYEKTSYDMLPLVFVAGDSAMIQEQKGGAYVQFTKPYNYHVKDVQRLKDFAGQTWAADIENMIISKWKMPIEGMPEQYQEAYKNPQEAQVIFYKSFFNDDPNHRLNDPQIIQRDIMPPMVENAFMVADRLTQMILGSYDAEIGIQGGNISGKAIQQGAMQSGEAADPYQMGYIRGLNRVAQIILSLIPKIYVTPRSIPVQLADGKRTYKIVNSDKLQNQQESGQDDPMMRARIYMNYEPDDLLVKVEATSSLGVQKQMALEYLQRIAALLPAFREFLDTDGMEIILDNVEFRGSDRMKVLYKRFMESFEKRQQQQAQFQQGIAEQKLKEEAAASDRADRKQQADELFKAFNLFLQKSELDRDTKVKAAEVAIDNKRANAEYLNVASKIAQTKVEAELQSDKVDAENTRTAVDLAIKLDEHNMNIDKHVKNMLSNNESQQEQKENGENNI